MNEHGEWYEGEHLKAELPERITVRESLRCIVELARVALQCLDVRWLDNRLMLCYPLSKVKKQNNVT